MAESYTQLHLIDDRKRCGKCERTLPVTEFWRRARSRDGLQARCKDCMRASATAWRTADPERWNAIQRDWTARNTDRRRAISRRSYQRHRIESVQRVSQWRKDNREWVRQYEKQYRSVDGRGAYYNRRYGHRIRTAPSAPFTAEQLSAKVAYWGHRCWMCRGPVQAIDHVKPLARGGAHCLANLRPICHSCNSRKSDKWPIST